MHREGGDIFAKLGRPFLDWFIKMGQVRTRDGWGVKKGLKKWDVLYGRSLTPTLPNESNGPVSLNIL